MGTTFTASTSPMTTAKDEKITQAKVTEAWLSLIQYVRDVVPYGQITFKVHQGEPMELIEAKPKVRFDKGWNLPKTNT